MQYVPLKCHTTYSLLSSIIPIDELVEKCQEFEYKSCAITDTGTLSGCVEFFNACKSGNIKPILGLDLNLSILPATIHDNNNIDTNIVTLIAKNYNGWKKLTEIVSLSNSEKFYWQKPRLDLNTLAEIVDDNIICINGNTNSDLYKSLFKNRDIYNDIKLGEDALEHAEKVLNKYIDIFGENLFVEIQRLANPFDSDGATDILRMAAKKNNIKCIATSNPHYIAPKDVEDYRVILCSLLKTTMKNGITTCKKTNLELLQYFLHNDYYFPQLDTISKYNTEEEINNTLYVDSLCESYDILRKPALPKYPCPNNMTELEYITDLCREGWRNKLIRYGIVKEKKKETEYLERLKTELSTIERAGLSGYFLIVRDYVKWCKDQGWFIGPGRGSAGGCLVSYLIDITQIDPIPHGLLFSRFYNEGRNTEGNISYPDIDIDFPIFTRGPVIKYIKEKYGEDKVCQIATFGRLQGRGALREVLRVHEACSNDEINKITKDIPDEAEISDDLEETKETSILQYILEHEPSRVQDYCRVNEGVFEGDYAQYFKQAIRLEGVLRTQGVHAAGVIVSPTPISEHCPMVRSKKGDLIAGFDMESLEKVGFIKLDILGLAALDKLMYVNDLLRGNYNVFNSEQIWEEDSNEY